MPQTVRIKTKREIAEYSVEIARGNLGNAGRWAREVLGGTRKIVLVSNKRVFDLHRGQLVKSLKSSGFNPLVHLIEDGEKYKNLGTLEQILEAFSRFEIARTDAVISFGGGVVGDIAGFAASIHLRGVDYLQIPTTLLSMVDSSVGGKTGINTEHGKNRVGSFYQPKGVLIDSNVLSSLPKREFTAGLCECIKHGMISGKGLLDQTVSVIEACHQDRVDILKNEEFAGRFESFLADQIAFKAKIVAGDERESVLKTDARSRKILNFGHTFAHALERATDFRYFRHGEAVGYGILFAAEVSKKLALLDGKVVNLLRDVVLRAGTLPSLSVVESDQVFQAIRYDKKNIDGSLQWVLLKEIGKPVIVPHSQIGDGLIRRTTKEFISAQ
jgi:3-dehydroquinate synthase